MFGGLNSSSRGLSVCPIRAAIREKFRSGAFAANEAHHAEKYVRNPRAKLGLTLRYGEGWGRREWMEEREQESEMGADINLFP